MDTVYITLISVGFPILSVVFTTWITNRYSLKKVQKTTNLEIYKEQMKKRNNAYQSIISTSKDLGDNYANCLYAFKNIDNPNEKFKFNAVEYRDAEYFLYVKFLSPYNDYKKIEKNNLIYLSNNIYKLVIKLSESIREIYLALNGVANNGFIVKTDPAVEEKFNKVKDDFDSAFNNLIEEIFKENDNLFITK